MEELNNQLINLLKTIEGSGYFQTSGEKKFIPPGLRIEGVGEIGFPLTPVQIKAIIGVARKAPFGKGSRTVTDTNVRSTWELDASQLTFQQAEWQEFMDKLLKKVKKGLGIEEQTVTASLYKMLIYEKGDFFLPHKDSEKEPGMFGTLVVGLPSAHTGGELVIRFGGKEETVDFSKAASHFKIPYTAFFADCDHELKPVTSGYRVCLVYNLVQPAGTTKIESPKIAPQVEKLAVLLKQMEGQFENRPKAVLLGHQYTPANFSLSHLKHHDRPRAEALLQAAEKAGYFAGLGLVTHYLIGDLEGGGYDYSYSHRHSRHKNEVEATMGSVYDVQTKIEHWSDDGAPTLGQINLNDEDLITDLEIGEGKPIDKHEEGYTGNEGMTMEYWYHYGAVILWPWMSHAGMLKETPVSVRLKWLDYYLLHWDAAGLHAEHYVRQLLAGFSEEEVTSHKAEGKDFSIVATALLKLNDEQFLLRQCESLLVGAFEKIAVEKWIELLQAYGNGAFSEIFEIVVNREQLKVINHLLDILKALTTLSSPACYTFLLDQVQQIPDYLTKVDLTDLDKRSGFYFGDTANRKEKIIAIVEKVLLLSAFKNGDAVWLAHALENLTPSLPRDYVNEVLVHILLHFPQKRNNLATALRNVCVRALNTRTAVKPTPPANWRREVPKTKQDRDIWEMLRRFLESPTERIFDYRQNESRRKEVESAISRVTVDLKMETIRSGTPYTLRLTKTQTVYDLALKHWNEDMMLLGQLQVGQL